MASYKHPIEPISLHRQKIQSVSSSYILITEHLLQYFCCFISIDAKPEVEIPEADTDWEEETTLYDDVQSVPLRSIHGTHLFYQVKNDCYCLYVICEAGDDVKLYFKKKSDAVRLNKIILEWLTHGTLPVDTNK